MCKWVKIYSVNTFIGYINMFEQFLILKSLPRFSQEAYVFNVFRLMRALYEKSDNCIVQNCIE